MAASTSRAGLSLAKGRRFYSIGRAAQLSGDLVGILDSNAEVRS
jgi:hypothetical protein